MRSSSEVYNPNVGLIQTTRSLARLLVLVAGAMLACAPGPACAQVNEVLVAPPRIHTPQVATPQRPPSGMPRFDLAARIKMSQGFAKQAVWLDDVHFITLVVRPESAEILRINYDTLARERFISSEFIDEHLGGQQHADRLAWTISPQKRYMFFSWFEDDGSRSWQLVDVADPPNFRLRRFEPPAGMQIERALFSPDDRYAVFFHDSYKEGGQVSVLVLNLQTGQEAWRINSSEVGFFKDAWWDGAVYDPPRFRATVMVHNGQFLDRAGLVTADIPTRRLAFTENTDGAITGASGVWGQVTGLQSAQGATPPYFLLVSQRDNREQVPLSNVPSRIDLLPESGMLLLANQESPLVRELWLIDVNRGSKYLVDGDTAEFAFNAGGRLLVRGEQSNELRIYELQGSQRPATTPLAEGQPRRASEHEPDEWIPH